MASREFEIAFPSGYFMSWSVTTQAGNNMTVKLFDNESVYLDKSKKGTSILPPLDINGSLIKGKNLKLQVKSEGAKELKSNISSYNITTPSGMEIGKGINICIEDWTDEDYNDAVIALVAWKNVKS